MNSPCPGCGRNRAPGKYLCLDCWRALPAPARTALSRRGNGAIRRYQSLVDQLRAGTKPADIVIPG